MHHISKKNNPTKRITLLIVLFFVFFGIIFARLFYLQIIRYDYYLKLAEQRHTNSVEIQSARGEIFVLKSGEPNSIATNQQKYIFYSVPALIEDATTTLQLIEKVFPMDDEERWQTWLKLIKKNDPYEPLKKNITLEEKNKLENVFSANLDSENLDIIGFQPISQRFYPYNNLYSHLLGFVGHVNDERIGQYGVEEYFEKELAGEKKIVEFERDPKGRLIGFGKNELSDDLSKGSNIVLTIDSAVQFKACEIIKKWQESMAAEDGSVIVMEPQTGKILAMCSVPNFDSNNYSQVESGEIYANKIINQAYEPGSVFKPFTMSAGIELGKFTPETKFDDKGFLKFGPDTIRNAANKKYGEVTMIQALENSINTALANVGLTIGRKNLKEYAEKFGFGEKTNITLPAESPGNINALNFKGEVYTATASYGQGIMTTLLQLASAYSTIANDGVLMQPQIVSEIIDPKGETEEFKSQKVRRAISSKTANIIKAMLVSVVKNGQAKKAGVSGYYVAGKTGTANIADPKGGYSEFVNHTFAGFAPVNNPKFVIVIKLSKPRNVPFSSDSATPAFGELAEYLLKYYQIPPDF